MNNFDADIEALEAAMRVLFQTLKRPQHWARVVSRSGIALDRPAAAILQILATDKSGRRHVHELATQLGIEAPSVTRTTQKLEQAGYVQRVPDAHDKRAIEVRITAHGRTAAKRLWGAHRKIISQALEHWQPAERQQFVKLFERFSHDLDLVPNQQQTVNRKEPTHV